MNAQMHSGRYTSPFCTYRTHGYNNRNEVCSRQVAYDAVQGARAFREASLKQYTGLHRSGTHIIDSLQQERRGVRAWKSRTKSSRFNFPKHVRCEASPERLADATPVQQRLQPTWCLFLAIPYRHRHGPLAIALRSGQTGTVGVGSVDSTNESNTPGCTHPPAGGREPHQPAIACSHCPRGLVRNIKSHTQCHPGVPVCLMPKRDEPVLPLSLSLSLAFLFDFGL